jgi:hypothetical protein
VVRAILLPVLGVFLASQLSAQVLYDAATSTLPTLQGWSFLSLPALASEVLEGGGARLDTTVSGGIFAGWSRLSPAPLDRVKGYTLSLELQLLSESHASTNRAGVSWIVLGSDRKGIEIGLWTDRIWAQSDAPMFTQAEGVARELGTRWRELSLTVQGDRYALAVDGVAALNGPLRDYTPFTGPIDPYETPNFLFLGDDTTSARGAVRFRKMQLILPPTMSPPLRVVGLADGQIELGWAGADGVGRWRLETSTTFLGGSWETAGAIQRLEAGEVRVRVAAAADAAWFRLR